MSTKVHWSRRIWPVSGLRRWRDAEIERFYRSQGYRPIDRSSEQDIFVCGYPKSGNTWVQNLLTSLLLGLEPRYLTDSLVQEVVPDVHVSSFYKRFFDTAYFKTHHLCQSRYRRIVHLVRDPRDVAASYYHFNLAKGKQTTLDQVVEFLIRTWRNHSETFLGVAGERDMLLLRYENLLAQPEREIERLVQFCCLDRPIAIRDRTIEGNRFSRIAERERKFGMANPRWPKEKSFFRKGQAGTSCETLNQENIAKIEFALSDLMSELGYSLKSSEA